MESVANRTEALKPYLPKLLTQWLSDDPDLSFRETDGSVTFVDISGFTKLSERLAKKGKVGAEELSDAIGSCFASLLAVAYGAGGGLIKFGGDALLLFFSGPDHSIRACQAAIGMRHALRRIGRLTTSGGKVTLRMSVGVHSGTFDFFLVGDSHRELMMAGPAVTQTVLMENTAEAGEILVSAEAAAAIPTKMVGKPKGEGFLIRGGGPALSPFPSESSVGVPADLLERSVSVATREHLLYGLAESEHRQVTVAFVHFDGTDDVIRTMGTRAAADKLGALVGIIQQAVDEQGVCFLGTDVDRDGGKIILTAGAPTASGNDEERMLLALRKIVEGAVSLPVRIGVNRGSVFAGDIGPWYRRTYTVMGDAVNLAARVMAAAEPGQILSTEAVLDRSRTMFATVPLEPFHVKGKARPVQAFALGKAVGARDTAEEDAGSRWPLVGRQAEMAVFRDALAAARRQHGGVVELIGEPGIGKSRLIEEVGAESGDLRRFALSCELYESSTPYFVFRGFLRDALGLPTTGGADAVDVLRSLVTRRAPHLLPWISLLSPVLDLELPSTPETDQLEDEFKRPRLAAVVGELSGLVLDAPTLITIEDAHWMDDASTDLLHRLVADVSERPWLICVTRRDMGTGFRATEGERAVTLRPAPLDQAAAAELVDTSSEAFPLQEHEIATLAERSGGNPLFLKELLAAARTVGGLEGLPDSIEAVITAQIDRLRPRDKTLLRYASVVGPAFSEDLAQSVLGDELPGLSRQTWTYLSDFLQRDEAGILRFQHALVRDVAYEGLPYRRRKHLHGAVGDAIERGAQDPDGEAELLSLHFFNSEHLEKAFRYSRIAGARAQALYANVEAADFYRRAIKAGLQVEAATADLADVWEALGDAQERAGLFDEAGDAYAVARRLVAENGVARARLLMKHSRIPDRSARYGRALGFITRGLHLLDDVDAEEARRLRARLCAEYAGVRLAQGRPSDAIPWCRRAMQEAESAGERDVLAHSYYLLDWAHVQLGRPEQATHSPAALDIYAELGDLHGQSNVLNNMGIFAYWSGQWARAADLYAQGRDFDTRRGDAVGAAMGTVNIGEILLDQGRLEEADAQLRSGLKVWRAAGYRWGIGFATTLLARLAVRSGRGDDAARLFAEARKIFDDLGASADVLEVDARIAESLALRGEWDEALSASGSLLERAGAEDAVVAQAPMIHRIRGEALAASGRHAEARVAFAESLRVARQRQADHEIAFTLRSLRDADLLTGAEPDTAAEIELRSIVDRLGITTPSGAPPPVADRSTTS